MATGSSDREPALDRLRRWVGQSWLFIAFFILISRLWYLQVMNGDRFRQYSEDNRIKKVKITSPRGMIFDRNKKRVLLRK